MVNQNDKPNPYIDKPITSLDKLVGFFDRISKWGASMAGYLVFGIFILTMLEVFLRNILGISTLVADDVSSLSMVGIVFLPLAYGLATGSHARFLLVHYHFGPKGQAVLDRLVAVIGAIFLFMLLPKAIKMMVGSYTGNMRSTAIIGIPLFIPQLLIVIGIVLFGFQFVAQIIRGR